MIPSHLMDQVVSETIDAQMNGSQISWSAHGKVNHFPEPRAKVAKMRTTSTGNPFFCSTCVVWTHRHDGNDPAKTYFDVTQSQPCSPSHILHNDPHLRATVCEQARASRCMEGYFPTSNNYGQGSVVCVIFMAPRGQIESQTFALAYVESNGLLHKASRDLVSLRRHASPVKI